MAADAEDDATISGTIRCWAIGEISNEALISSLENCRTVPKTFSEAFLEAIEAVDDTEKLVPLLSCRSLPFLLLECPKGSIGEVVNGLLALARSEPDVASYALRVVALVRPQEVAQVLEVAGECIRSASVSSLAHLCDAAMEVFPLSLSKIPKRLEEIGRRFWMSVRAFFATVIEKRGFREGEGEGNLCCGDEVDAFIVFLEALKRRAPARPSLLQLWKDGWRRSASSSLPSSFDLCCGLFLLPLPDVLQTLTTLLLSTEGVQLFQSGIVGGAMRLFLAAADGESDSSKMGYSSSSLFSEPQGMRGGFGTAEECLSLLFRRCLVRASMLRERLAAVTLAEEMTLSGAKATLCALEAICSVLESYETLDTIPFDNEIDAAVRAFGAICELSSSPTSYSAIGKGHKADEEKGRHSLLDVSIVDPSGLVDKLGAFGEVAEVVLSLFTRTSSQMMRSSIADALSSAVRCGETLRCRLLMLLQKLLYQALQATPMDQRVLSAAVIASSIFLRERYEKDLAPVVRTLLGIRLHMPFDLQSEHFGSLLECVRALSLSPFFDQGGKAWLLNEYLAPLIAECVSSSLEEISTLVFSNREKPTKFHRRARKLFSTRTPAKFAEVKEAQKEMMCCMTLSGPSSSAFSDSDAALRIGDGFFALLHLANSLAEELDAELDTHSSPLSIIHVLRGYPTTFIVETEASQFLLSGLLSRFLSYLSAFCGVSNGAMASEPSDHRPSKQDSTPGELRAQAMLGDSTLLVELMDAIVPRKEKEPDASQRKPNNNSGEGGGWRDDGTSHSVPQFKEGGVGHSQKRTLQRLENAVDLTVTSFSYLIPLRGSLSRSQRLFLLRSLLSISPESGHSSAEEAAWIVTFCLHAMASAVVDNERRRGRKMEEGSLDFSAELGKDVEGFLDGLDETVPLLPEVFACLRRWTLGVGFFAQLESDRYASLAKKDSQDSAQSFAFVTDERPALCPVGSRIAMGPFFGSRGCTSMASDAAVCPPIHTKREAVRDRLFDGLRSVAIGVGLLMEAEEVLDPEIVGLQSSLLHTLSLLAELAYTAQTALPSLHFAHTMSCLCKDATAATARTALFLLGRRFSSSVEKQREAESAEPRRRRRQKRPLDGEAEAGGVVDDDAVAEATTGARPSLTASLASQPFLCAEQGYRDVVIVAYLLRIAVNAPFSAGGSTTALFHVLSIAAEVEDYLRRLSANSESGKEEPVASRTLLTDGRRELLETLRFEVSTLCDMSEVLSLPEGEMYSLQQRVREASSTAENTPTKQVREKRRPPREEKDDEINAAASAFETETGGDRRSAGALEFEDGMSALDDENASAASVSRPTSPATTSSKEDRKGKRRQFRVVYDHEGTEEDWITWISSGCLAFSSLRLILQYVELAPAQLSLAISLLQRLHMAFCRLVKRLASSGWSFPSIHKAAYEAMVLSDEARAVLRLYVGELTLAQNQKVIAMAKTSLQARESCEAEGRARHVQLFPLPFQPLYRAHVTSALTSGKAVDGRLWAEALCPSKRCEDFESIVWNEEEKETAIEKQGEEEEDEERTATALEEKEGEEEQDSVAVNSLTARK